MRIEATLVNDTELTRKFNEAMERNELNYRVYAIAKEETKRIYGTEINYIVMGKKIKSNYGGDFCILTSGWIDSDGEGRMEHGHYDLYEKEANKYLLCPSLCRSNFGNVYPPNFDRALEIATKAIYQLIDNDPDEAYPFIKDELELDEDECKFFELDYNEVQHYDEWNYEDEEDDNNERS